MPVTKEDAEMLATLAARCRPYKARQWDAPGIMAALAKVRHVELAEVMMAVGRAARDRSLETPAAIGNLAAPCWIERPVERPVPEKTTAVDRCGECSQPRHVCESMPRWGGDDHTFRPDFKAPAGSAVAELRDIKAKATHATTADTDEHEEQA